MRQELGRFFKRYELLEVDAPRVAKEVSRAGRFSFATSQGTVNLTLAPHDMRAPNYRAVKVGADGVALTLEAWPVHTFKGVVTDAKDSQARFTIDEGHVEGLIIKGGERFRLEPAQRFSTSAARTDFVFYKASDVIHDTTDTCGVSLIEKISTASNISGQAQTNFPPPRVIELATEADHEYVSALGGPANALDEILSIMNQVEGVYETELGLTFRITFQHAWETAADPYPSTTDSIRLLNEFGGYWNANFNNVARDVAHMWTGKNMGGVLGRAHQSVACNFPSLSYGLSRNDDRVPLKFNTPAHEIAHNLGATHADGILECVGSIMRPTTTSGLTFCQFSRFEVAQYVSQSGHCLAAAPTHSISGQVTDINGKPIGGVRMEASGSQTMTTQTDAGGRYSFGDLTQDGTYVVTPSRDNYTFAPPSQTFNTLSGDAAAHFTVTGSPDGPMLATDGGSNRAVALDSVTFLRDPFPVSASHNFSPDRRTRVLLFAVNVVLAPGESVSVLNAQAEDADGDVYPLAVESVERVPTFGWLTQMTVKLPDELSNAGDVLVSVSVRGSVSNKVLISIAPPGTVIP